MNNWQLEYTSLLDGENITGQLCPRCRGGGTNEHSFSVGRYGPKLLWKCHRASCGFSGISIIGKADSSYVKPTLTRGLVGVQYYKDAEIIPQEVASILENKYSLSKYNISILGWDSTKQRVVLPVMDWEGNVVGSVLRSEHGGVPKALSNTDPDAMACFTNSSSSDCIIVEDIYSAMRASTFINACALNGTNLNYSRVQNIANQKFNNCYLALDKDAFNKTIYYVKEYRSVTTMIPIYLSKDIKNMQTDEIELFFSNIVVGKNRNN